jgi:hypothetical protein
MHNFNRKLFRENIKLSKMGFLLYSPISILAFPVTVLVVNPGSSFWLLAIWGLILTISMYLFYLPFVWINNHIPTQKIEGVITNFLVAAIFIGSIRGFLFFQIVDFLELKAPGSLINRIMASTATTLFWLSTSNILINFSRTFRARYQQSLNRFIKRNLDALPSLMPSDKSTDEIINLQKELSQSLASRLENSDAENLREVSELLKSKINLRLRPLSRRIWLRSLNEYPVIKFRQMLKDCIYFLDYSKPIFLIALFCLALLDNIFIRSITESITRTISFFAILLSLMWLRNRLSFFNNYLYLTTIGVLPVLGSEYISHLLGFKGSWTATILITLVAPALMVVLSLFKLTLRDHGLIIELLENFDIDKFSSKSTSFDAGERRLASYLHNSLQSELLAIAGQLESAAVGNDIEKSSAILQRVSSLINRSFIDDFQNFSESPLERLQTIRNSWFGILEIEIDLPESLLSNPERNAALVQTIEEFAANSFRHGKATAIKVSAVSSSAGLQLTLHSNGSGKISPKRGLGSEWIDQISRTPWKLRRTGGGTTLEITL